jgi:hypothetical protein
MSGALGTSREIGYALSACTHDFLVFVVFEGETVKVNHFYFLKHPFAGTAVLARVFRVQPYNPEMEMGRTGPLAGKKHRRADYGKKLEYVVGYAEILGYYDSDEKWRQMEVAPSPWDAVYEPTEEDLKEFILRKKFAEDALIAQIGKVRGTNIPVYFDLNSVAKAHLFVAGMTRSGKSSFIINLVRSSSTLSPRPRFVIFDRRGEYGGLTKYGAVIFPYTEFMPSLTNPDLIVEKLELKRTEKDVTLSAIRILLEGDEEVTQAKILEKVQELAEKKIATEKTRKKTLENIEWALKNKGAFLERGGEPLDIISQIRNAPVIIVDFSVDTDIEGQQRTGAYLLAQIRDHAMAQRSSGGFAVILVVEEAQYLAPEKGTEVKESSAQGEAKAAFVETISQAGGYNVGLIVMTQRPAYVAKSVISQCNSVSCFRLKSGNDQAAIMDYTEYGSERLAEYLPGLADHEAMLWGMSIPTPFPLIAEIDVKDYPRKAAAFAKQAWEKMGEIEKT